MLRTDLNEGDVVVISHNVKNPKPDRRRSDRDWASAPVWNEGRRLLVRVSSRTASRLSSGYYGVSEHDEGFDALLSACVPAPRTLSNILWAACDGGALISHADGILGVLVTDGKVSLDDVEEALTKFNARELAEEA